MTGMRIKSIRLTNFRKFRSLDLSFQDGLCVLVGDNGAGKSTLLEAIAISLSRFFPFCPFNPRLAAKPLSVSCVTQWGKERRGKIIPVQADYCSVSCTVVSDGDSAEYTLTAALRKDTSGVFVPALSSEETRSNAAPAMALNIGAESGRPIPAIALYGPHRGAQQGDRKRFTRKKIDCTNPFSAYFRALEPSLDFTSFLEWFSEEEAAEFRMQRRDKNYVSAELQAVREAVERVFAGRVRYRNPRFEANPKRFVLSEIGEDGVETERAFDQLSDGYRSMIALVVDFARRLALAHAAVDMRQGVSPLDGPGILLVDEIDVHLHPGWQYHVLADLRRCFPNVQMIITTHSAELITGVDARDVYILQDTENGPEIHTPEYQTAGWGTPQVNAGVMSVSNTPALPINRVDEELRAHVQAGDTESPRFTELSAEYVRHFGKEHPLVRLMDSRIQIAMRRKEHCEGK